MTPDHSGTKQNSDRPRRTPSSGHHHGNRDQGIDEDERQDTAQEQQDSRKQQDSQKQQDSGQQQPNSQQQPESDQGQQDSDQEQQDQSEQGRTRRTAAWAIAAVRSQFGELSGQELEQITGVEKGKDSTWTVSVEVVDIRMVPDTADIIAQYDVTVDEEGDIIGYRRVRRHLRGRADD